MTITVESRTNIFTTNIWWIVSKKVSI